MLTRKEIVIPKNPPKLIIILGPCRTGTTALANNFVRAGVLTYMQPMKSARTAKELGDRIIPWNINSAKTFVVLKETIGPSKLAEFFDPLQILLNLGYPKEKIQIIPIVRSPIQTLVSWKRMWGNISREKFIESYRLIHRIKNKSESMGIKTIPYVHEVIRDNPPKKVVLKLFKELCIKAIGQDITSNWPNFKLSPNIYFYDSPPDKFIYEIGKRGKYEYKEYKDLSEENDEITPELNEIYEDFRKSCEIALGFRIRK